MVRHQEHLRSRVDPYAVSTDRLGSAVVDGTARVSSELFGDGDGEASSCHTKILLRTAELTGRRAGGPAKLTTVAGALDSVSGKLAATATA